MHIDPENICPECGARSAQEISCRDMFNQVLAWEAQDPELHAEHFLLVASYNLQHPAQFTAEAIDGLRAAYIRYLDQGAPIATIRKQVGKAVGGQQKVLKPDAERRPILRHWNVTIADVYLADQPDGAAERVRAWAAATRREL